MAGVGIPLDLWEYLRGGIAYVESSGGKVPYSYVHPGGVAYGPLGLTAKAFEDVQRIFPEYKRYKWEDIIRNPNLYEDVAKKYADIISRLYLHLSYTLPREEIMKILGEAWRGPIAYKKGTLTPLPQRTRSLEEYIRKYRRR